jgi:hypothetical protein
VRSPFLPLLLVAVVAFALLGYGIERASVGTAYSDPVSKLRAQDECNYANSALGLAHTGGWLTPRVLGRYLLFKPPLLVWLAGFSLKIFGQSLFALRLPALAAAVCVAVILFWWMHRERPILTACAAAALFLGNPLMHIFARLCYTDMLAVAAISGTLAFFYADPSLVRTRSLWFCGASLAAGIMAKNVAGLLPLFIVALYCLLVSRDKRPPLARLALMTMIAAALVAPWHIYQLIAHRQWFWADYVQVQLLGFGIQLPVTSEESQAGFYFRRLFLTDPTLALLLVTALPFLISALRGRKHVLPALLTAWFAIAAGALLLFRYQNLPYAILLIPPACLIAAAYNPLFSGQRAKWGMLALCAIFAVKWSAPGKIWGLGFGAAQPLPAVAGLRAYYNLGRANELILADSDDFFYASTLTLPRVRYYFRAQDDAAQKSFPHYVQLGIMLTEDQFERLPQLEPAYRARLTSWGLNSTAPIGTAILGHSDDALLHLVKSHPNADYYVTVPALQLLERDESIRRTHAVSELPYGRALLLALNTASRPVVPLPARW